MNTSNPVYAAKNMVALAKVGKNSVGWVQTPSGPELRIYIIATNEWITKEEHEKRKNERRIAWFAKPKLVRKSARYWISRSERCFNVV